MELFTLSEGEHQKRKRVEIAATQHKKTLTLLLKYSRLISYTRLKISYILMHLFQSLEGIGLEHRQALTEAVYDELIISVLRIVERLDLTSNKPSEIETEVM